MSIIKKLIAHSSLYMTGEVIVMAGGLISFPIIARLLSQEQYGLMVIVSTTIILAESLSTGGLHHASIRFYSHYNETGETGKFCSTLIFGSLAFGIVGTLLLIFLFKSLSVFYFVSENIRDIFFLALPLVLIRIMTHIFGSLYRVREKPSIYISFAILNKYISLALIILFLTLFYLELFGYYLGLLLGELTVVLLYWFITDREVEYSIRNVSIPMLRQATAYGFPLVFSGLAGTLLSSSDRYLIGHFMTKVDVAIYSVPYNLCSYLSGILTSGFEFALIPIIMNEWNKGAFDRVHLELQRVIRLYCMAAFPLVAGICALGRQIIVLFASDKYSEAYYILPYVIVGVMIQGLLTPLMMGLIFSNSSKQIAIMTWQAASLNIIMNLFLIPEFGLLGAAVSTLFCYVLLAFVGTIRSSRHFAIKMPWLPIILYALAAFFMFFTLQLISFYFPGIMLYTQIGIGAVLYLTFIVVSDKKFRLTVVEQIQSFVKLK